MRDFQLTPVAGSITPTILAEIRAEAMRPSLEAIGRFDPVRVRDRFLNTYEEKDTFLIKCSAELAGFYVLRDERSHFYLDHLYLKPELQHTGLGSAIMRHIQSTSDKPITLMALKGSPANAFYVKAGFELISQDEFDNHYQWEPHQKT